MIEHWARHTHGMMGRSPDYMNTVMMSFASSAELLRDKENCFPEHILDMYKQVAKHDLSFTHTFITPQVNWSQSYFGFSENQYLLKSWIGPKRINCTRRASACNPRRVNG